MGANAKFTQYIIGIDEVGRGSLAGPVTVAAVALPARLKIKNPSAGQGNLKLKIPLRDSKKLSLKQREAWFGYLKKHPRVFYAVAHVQPKVINKINISKAANRAASRAFAKLLTDRSAELTTPKIRIFLDGGLHLSKKEHAKLNAKTIVKGDEKLRVIALASIAAKVTRDRLMERLHKKFPKYGFNIHKGYGTKAHFAALKRFGQSEKHRLSFIQMNF